MVHRLMVTVRDQRADGFAQCWSTHCAGNDYGACAARHKGDANVQPPTATSDPADQAVCQGCNS